MFVTASEEHAWFGVLASGGEADIRPLPAGFNRQIIALALDPSGAPFLAVDQTGAGGDQAAGVTFYDPLNERAERVFERSAQGGAVHDFEFDTQGRAHVWSMTGSAPGAPGTVPAHESTRFIRDPASGRWTPQPAPIPDTSGWRRFGLTRGDRPVGFGFAQGLRGEWRLYADEGAGGYPIGSSFGDFYPQVYTLAVPPALPELSGTGPDYLVFSQHESSFRIAAPVPGGFQELQVPGANRLEPRCLADYDGRRGSCPTTCDERSDGLMGSMTAVARSADGRVWAARVVAHIDRTRKYTEACADEAGCWCNSEDLRDESWAEIVLAQVDFAAETVVDVMRVRTLDPELLNSFLRDFWESARLFDMRAFDQRLAIGLRVRSPSRGLGEPDMRLLLVDTGMIP